MSVEIITREDLQAFRIQLVDDIKKMLSAIQPSKDKPEWIKSGEVRKILKISAGTLQNLRITDKLHPVKISGSWYYDLAEINTLFNAKTI